MIRLCCARLDDYDGSGIEVLVRPVLPGLEHTDAHISPECADGQCIEVSQEQRVEEDSMRQMARYREST